MRTRSTTTCSGAATWSRWVVGRRRYGWKALASDPERARHILALIGELFRIERTIAEAPMRKRRVARDRQSRPIVERFFEWCDAEVGLVLDDTPIAKAIGYARNQRAALSPFLDDPRLPARRVGRWRGCGRLPVAMLCLSASAPQSGLPWPRFQRPLVEPDVQISRIRLPSRSSRLRPRLAA